MTPYLRLRNDHTLFVSLTESEAAESAEADRVPSMSGNARRRVVIVVTTMQTVMSMNGRVSCDAVTLSSGTPANYQTLGFTTALRTINGTEEVAFLQLHNLVIETYQNRQAAMAYGAIDHIAIDVKNIDELFKVVQRAGLKMLDTKVNGLPFWENGVKFFTIEGPNKEKIEFCEKL